MKKVLTILTVLVATSAFAVEAPKVEKKAEAKKEVVAPKAEAKVEKKAVKKVKKAKKEVTSAPTSTAPVK